MVLLACTARITSSAEKNFNVSTTLLCFQARRSATAISRTTPSLRFCKKKTIPPIHLTLPKTGDATDDDFRIRPRAALAAGSDEYMPPQTITCPDCGLVLRVKRNDADSTLIYDVTYWQRHCKRPQRDNPAWLHGAYS